MTSRLFVYGTLRKDSGNGVSQMLAREARFVGRARVQGRLFHLGEYPGLVPSRDPGSWIHGEVYAFENPPDALARLDDFEGCGPNDPEPHAFERVEKDIVLESGTRDNVWVYVYRGSTTDKKEILSGDYFKEAL
ncbi:MAG: gamma-glutamylcyclotransferase [Pseudomonadota bacterium]|nr:gamma-glutamylcyclotransferase [Pseudomonadota bacterium]